MKNCDNLNPFRKSVNKIWIFFLFILPGMMFFGCRDGREIPSEKIIGVKIYDHPGELEDLFNQLESTGINTLFTSPELALRKGFMNMADNHGMPVFLIVPTFYNPEVLAEDSSLFAVTATGNKAVDDWVEFICPNRKDYRMRHLEYLKSLVVELSPAGLSIDFIRYFVFWEKVYPGQTILDLPQTCFDDTCLSVFVEEYQILIPENMTDLKGKADYIIEHHGLDWAEFKVKTITSYVQEITRALNNIDPDLKFNLHLVPWRRLDFDGAIRKVAGQEVKLLAPWVDYLSPMCYSHMVKQSPTWIHELVVDTDQSSKGQVLPSIQVGRAYREEPFLPGDFRNALQSALKAPSLGVIFWSWEALVEDPEKRRVVIDELVLE